MTTADLGDVFDAGQNEFAVLAPVLWNPLGEATVAEASPRPGDRVLDVCCGAGATAWAIVMGSAMRMRLNGVAESVLPKVRARFIDLLATRKVDHMNAVSLIGIGRTAQ